MLHIKHCIVTYRSVYGSHLFFPSNSLSEKSWMILNNIFYHIISIPFVCFCRSCNHTFHSWKAVLRLPSRKSCIFQWLFCSSSWHCNDCLLGCCYHIFVNLMPGNCSFINDSQVFFSNISNSVNPSQRKFTPKHGPDLAFKVCFLFSHRTLQWLVSCYLKIWSQWKGLSFIKAQCNHYWHFKSVIYVWIFYISMTDQWLTTGRLQFWWKSTFRKSAWFSQCVIYSPLLHGLDSTGTKLLKALNFQDP